MEQFGDFLSHSWRTDPWEKAVTLRFMYNFRAATVGSIIVAFALFFVSRDANVLPPMDPHHYSVSVEDTVPLSAYCSVFGAFTFVFLFIFWQDMKVTLIPRSKVRMAFFDKLRCLSTQLPISPVDNLNLHSYLFRQSLN